MPRQIELKALPRLAREGFGSPVTGRRVPVKHMLIPRPERRFDRSWAEWEEALLTGQLGPPERRALREITETGDLVNHQGHTYLIARVSSETLDALAAFEAERANLESDGSDEPGIGDTDRELDMSDDEPDHDAEEVGYRP